MKRASDQIRKAWVMRLRRMLDPETGRVIETAFQEQQALYQKATQKRRVDDLIMHCDECSLRACPRTCGWGNLNARHLFIGQSLHEPGAVSGIPFICGSGYLIDAALRLVGLHRRDVFLTNAVHCHPESNKPSTPEQLKACLPFLAAEIDVVRPDMILCLGNDAKGVISQVLSLKAIPYICKHSPPIIVYLRHPAAAMRGSPEATWDWVLRCAREMERA